MRLMILKQWGSAEYSTRIPHWLSTGAFFVIFIAMASDINYMRQAPWDSLTAWFLLEIVLTYTAIAASLFSAKVSVILIALDMGVTFATQRPVLPLIAACIIALVIFGRELRANRADILPRIGSLIEGPAFYPHLTGAQNLRIVADYLSCDKSSVDAVLDVVGLTDAAGKRARQYSLGMKQRLGIAMALISGPELLLLDEPTNGLDPAGVAEIRNLIVRLAHDRGITVMVSSHLLSEIEQMADIVGIIQSGHLRYQGPLSGLRDQGQLVMKVSPVNAAVAHLEALGLRPQSAGDEIILPPLRDDLIAEAVARLVGAGVRIARVELRRKSLEEAFLELTETPVVMPTAPQTTGRRGRA